MTTPEEVIKQLPTDSEQILADKIMLGRALIAFVWAYERAADPIGDSDLYDEQPRSVSVTLGDCRRATALLHSVGLYTKEPKTKVRY
jgi:hypothetical protein